MGKLGGKIRNTATQAYSRKFSSEDIARQSREGEHNGEPMARVFARIMNDPAIKQVETKKPGVYDLIYTSNDKEAVVGWMDMNRGMGEISQKAYDHVQDISMDGCYIIKKDDEYAVRAYTDELGKNGKYVIDDDDPEADTRFTFTDDVYTGYDTYEEAARAAYAVSVQLGIAPSYDDDYDDGTAPDYDDSEYDDDIPSTGGYNPRDSYDDPHAYNGGGEYDMDPNFTLDDHNLGD